MTKRQKAEAIMNLHANSIGGNWMVKESGQGFGVYKLENHNNPTIPGEVNGDGTKWELIDRVS